MINTYIKIRKLIERKQYKTARVLIDSALQQNSDDVELIYLLAIWFFEQKKYESAADYANHAIILNPNFLLGYHLLTMAKMNTKNYQEALNVIKQAKNIDSNFSELYWLEASIYHYFGLTNYKKINKQTYWLDPNQSMRQQIPKA